jgi:Pyruvate/2-oxoacid:ferredoxin oxidoreductase gamma subunit
MEREVILTGIGGQGIQLIAKVLAQAGIDEGRHVMMFGIFKGTIRGGSSESTVVIADREIIAPPIVSHTWGVLAMHGEDLPKIVARARPGGVFLVNTSLIAKPPVRDDLRTIAIPATEIAKEMGNVMGASMVALGAFVAATGIVPPEALDRALGTVLPPHRKKLIDANRASLARGAAYVATNGAPEGIHAWA